MANKTRRDVQGHHRDRGGTNMIANDQELKVTLDRIAQAPGSGMTMDLFIDWPA
jgi:hypothetical protein